MKLLFCTSLHGYNLETFYQNCASFLKENFNAPFLLIVQDTQGALFGAFCSDLPSITGTNVSVTFFKLCYLSSGKQRFGNGETFLYSFKNGLTIWHTKQSLPYYVHVRYLSCFMRIICVCRLTEARYRLEVTHRLYFWIKPF